VNTYCSHGSLGTLHCRGFESQKKANMPKDLTKVKRSVHLAEPFPSTILLPSIQKLLDALRSPKVILRRNSSESLNWSHMRIAILSPGSCFPPLALNKYPTDDQRKRGLRPEITSCFQCHSQHKREEHYPLFSERRPLESLDSGISSGRMPMARDDFLMDIRFKTLSILFCYVSKLYRNYFSHENIYINFTVQQLIREKFHHSNCPTPWPYTETYASARS
jgi:hypothetical protein